MVWELVLDRPTTVCANFILSGDHAVVIALGV